MNRILFSLFFSILSSGFFVQMNAQTIEHPVFSDKTHPTLYIDSIVHTPMASIFYISVVNQLEEGDAWFCADENILLQNKEENYQVKLFRTEGIPVCPEMHQFEDIGESISFKLFFPLIPENISSVDLIENCEDNCFKISEIILDPAITAEVKKFENAVLLYRQGANQVALADFLELAQSDNPLSDHYLSLIHYIIPVIYLELQDEDQAKEWYQKLNASDHSFKDEILSKLRENEFFMGLMD